MPTSQLLQAQPVHLTLPLRAIISHHGDRVVCERCGEDIINERAVIRDGHSLCRACAGNAYYEILSVASRGAVLGTTCETEVAATRSEAWPP